MWTGYLVDERNETVHRIDSDYKTREATANNAGRCYEEQTGNPADMVRSVVVSIESDDGENIDEIIELVARDLVENTFGVTQGYRIGPAITVCPPEPDALQIALKTARLGKTGRALMDAIALEGIEDPEVLASEFAEFVRRMTA